MSKQTGMHLALCLLASVPFTEIVAQETPPLPDRPKTISSTVTLVTDDEPGEPLTITGTVYKSDRKTPSAGVVLYVYQTDVSGVYNKTDRNWKRPRIKGWFRTDKNGRYEIRTIKPGSYPQSKNPAHIHIVIVPENKPPRWLDEFLFEGDPYLTERDLQAAKQGTFSPVMKIERDSSGTLHCARDFALTSD